MALRTAKRTFSTFAPRKFAFGIVKGRDKLFPMHQELAFLGKAFFLAFLGAKLFKLVNRMAQPFFFFARLVDPVGGRSQFLLCVPPCTPLIPYSKGKTAKIAMGIKGRTMGCRVQQTVLVKLALNFDAVIADIAQKPDRNRLIIDIGA